MKRKIVSLALLFCMLFSVSGVKSSATEVGVTEDKGYIETRATVKNEIGLKSIQKKENTSYRQIAIFFNERSLDTDARLINGITYIALKSFISRVAPEMNVYYNAQTRTLGVYGEGLEMTAKDGSYTLIANGRALFNTSPIAVMANGELYVPILTAARALGFSLVPGGDRIHISGKVNPIMSGDKFYREDAVYWLSRIISAESRGESLLGQIAVGNVVMNRVASPLYPNTIWGVIFDKKYGVQFSPILDGSIYNPPTESAVIAAKVVLEGYSVNSEVLFFLAPRYAQSSWIPKSREYEFSIGNHDFYS